MADTQTGLRATLAPYRAVLASRVRSQASYRTSFALDLTSSLLVGLTELAEVAVLFTSVTAIGGFDLGAMLLVFGLADLCFSLADMVFGHCDDLPSYIRSGRLDVFYLRPQPLLAQLVTSDISLRRLARASVGVVALVVGLAVNDLDWGAGTVALLVVSVVSGVATFSALFVWAAGMQFFLVNGSEMTNAFVYGGRYAATQPGTVWGRPLTVVFGFFFPMAFTAYLPATTLLGLEPFADLPTWVGWCAPVAAAWAWVAALTSWRLGTRHYQGAGG